MELPKKTNVGMSWVLNLALITLCVGTSSWAMNSNSSNTNNNNNSNNFSSMAAFVENLARYTDPDVAQKHIRLYVEGKLDACLDLYKEAKAKDNPMAQIYIANASYAMRWAKDDTKNFKNLPQFKIWRDIHLPIALRMWWSISKKI